MNDSEDEISFQEEDINILNDVKFSYSNEDDFIQNIKDGNFYIEKLKENTTYDCKHLTLHETISLLTDQYKIGKYKLSPIKLIFDEEERKVIKTCDKCKETTVFNNIVRCPFPTCPSHNGKIICCEKCFCENIESQKIYPKCMFCGENQSICFILQNASTKWCRLDFSRVINRILDYSLCQKYFVDYEKVTCKSCNNGDVFLDFDEYDNEIFMCNSCNEICESCFDKKHEGNCDEDFIKLAEDMSKIGKLNCPKCLKQLYSISGTPRITCFNCHEIYNYETNNIETSLTKFPFTSYENKYCNDQIENNILELPSKLKKYFSVIEQGIKKETGKIFTYLKNYNDIKNERKHILSKENLFLNELQNNIMVLKESYEMADEKTISEFVKDANEIESNLEDILMNLGKYTMIIFETAVTISYFESMRNKNFLDDFKIYLDENNNVESIFYFEDYNKILIKLDKEVFTEVTGDIEEHIASLKNYLQENIDLLNEIREQFTTIVNISTELSQNVQHIQKTAKHNFKEYCNELFQTYGYK